MFNKVKISLVDFGIDIVIFPDFFYREILLLITKTPKVIFPRGFVVYILTFRQWCEKYRYRTTGLLKLQKCGAVHGVPLAESFLEALSGSLNSSQSFCMNITRIQNILETLFQYSARWLRPGRRWYFSIIMNKKLSLVLINFNSKGSKTQI